MSQKYQGIRFSSVEDSSARNALHVIDRHLRQRALIDAAFTQENNPKVIITTGPGGNLPIHTHEDDNQGGATLGQVAKDIRGRGGFHFFGAAANVVASPDAIVHIQSPRLTTSDNLPTSTTATGNWARQPENDGSLHLALDEVFGTPTSYVETATSDTSTFEVRLTVVEPTDKTGILIKIRAIRNAGASGNITWNLNENVTSRASGTISGITASWADYTDTVSEAEALTITDWDNLRISINQGGAAGVQIRLSYCVLQTSSGESGTEIPLIVQGGIDQDIDILSVRDSADVSLAGFDSAGQLYLGDATGDKLTFAPNATTTAYGVTFPAAQGAAGTVLLDAAGDGVLTWDDGSGLDGGQFFLLAGRSGGQIGNGDTASGGDLTLVSTAHATKNDIIFGAAGGSRYQEDLDRWAMNRATASAVVHAEAESVTVPAFYGEITATDPTGTSDGAVMFLESTREDFTNGVTANKTLKIEVTLEDLFAGNVSGIDATLDIAEYDFFGNQSEAQALKFLTKSHFTEPVLQLAGALGRVDHLGSGLLGKEIGFLATVAGNSGDITEAIGVSIFGSFVTNPTVTDYRGIKINNPNAAFGAVITNLYGIFLPALTTGGTSNWAIYSEGADSWFQNTIRISDAIRLIDPASGSGGNYVELRSPAGPTSYTLDLPGAAPAGAGEYLRTLGATTSQFAVIPAGDLPVHDNTKHTDRTRQEFIGADSLLSTDGAVVEIILGATNVKIRAAEFIETTAPQRVMTEFIIPDDYSSFVGWYLHYSSVDENSANARVTLRNRVLADGDVVTVAHDASTTTDIAVVNNQKKTTQISTDSTSFAAGAFVRTVFERDSVHANDTLSVSLYVHALEFRYTADM